MKNILVVDDDNRIRDLLSAFLTRNGFVVTKAANSIQAKAHINVQNFDLIVLDIMMPGGEDGVELTQKLRENKNNTPIILLTAKDTLADKIDGLNHGADDYVLKPFEPDELLARIKSLLRRSSPLEDHAPEIFKFDDIYFDKKTTRLFTSDNEEIFLSSTEQLILKALSQNPFNPISRTELATRSGFVVNERTIDVQITRLRKKLGDDVGQPRFIKTIRHVGYALYPEDVDSPPE